MKTILIVCVLLLVVVTPVLAWTYQITVRDAYMWAGEWIFVPAGSEVYLASCKNGICHIQYGPPGLPPVYWYDGWIVEEALGY